MASLYNIQEDLQSIFNQVEDNDGEITDEQYDALIIKQEELTSKLNDYVKAIKVWKGDADTCKAEKKRINDVQKKYENRIERLKKSMLDAVEQFGTEGKKNKFIELPTVRLYTKSSTSIETDETRINILLNEIERYVSELVNSGVLYTGEDVDLTGILESINANIIAEQGEDFKPFSITDLTTLQLQVVCKGTLYDLFKDHSDVLYEIGNHPLSCKLSHDTPKEVIKTTIEAIEANDLPELTIGNKVTNNNLMIK